MKVSAPMINAVFEKVPPGQRACWIGIDLN